MATIKGKWIWADAIESNLEPGYVIEATIPFVSNRESFSGLYIQGFAVPSHVNIQYGGINGILVTRHQLNENNEVILCKILETYRVMDFGEGGEINDEVYNFIVEHATPYTYTVSEKLEIIAKNEKAVYQSGYDKALELGGYSEGFEDGKQDEYDAFWDAFQNYGKRTDYQRGFFGQGWNDITFKPKRGIEPKGNCTSIFDSSNITDLKGILDERGLALDTSKATILQYMITSSKITRIGTIDTTGCASIQNLFSYESSLVYVEKIILKDDGTQTTNDGAFNQLESLEHIEFEGIIGGSLNFKASTGLTEPSIRSIITHLSDAASGKTLTLSKAAVLNAFELLEVEEGWLVGTYITEWLELVNSKTNWTINLV
jgi:hypothetical protein